MSFDYYVAVSKDNWPTAASLQGQLEKLGYPLRLSAAPDRPFSVPDDAFELPVVFEGRPVGLEADIEQVTDVDDRQSLLGYIAQRAAPGFTISNGDLVLTLTFRDEIDQIRAGLYLAAAMILNFDGYGFENQTETHGQADFARQLLLEAANPIF